MHASGAFAVKYEVSRAIQIRVSKRRMPAVCTSRSAGCAAGAQLREEVERSCVGGASRSGEPGDSHVTA